MILQYEPYISDDDKQAVIDYIKTEGVWLTEFKETRKLEKKIADYLGMKYCSIVSNGTISLSLALLAGGICPGDKVIVPNLTMIATATAVSLIGAIPILVDVAEDDSTLSYNEVLETLQYYPDIKALIYVSLNGRGKRYNLFQQFCKAHNIFYVTDDAQSLGSRLKTGEKIGNSPLSSFSFSMPKIITTGQGGCLVTNDSYLYKKILKLRDFGREKSGIDYHPQFGINSKFTDLQAVVGISQIQNIELKIQQKKNIFFLYREYLKNIKNISFIDTDLEYTTPWFVDVYVEKKLELIEYLKSENIGTRPIYPPIHTQGEYRNKRKYPVSSNFSEKGLWLPSSLTLTKENIAFICEKIERFYQ